jgi:FAD/FMN-containing dehydrogenase
MKLETPTQNPAAALKERLGDLIHLPGDAEYERLCVPWHVIAVQRPAAVAVPRTTEDVATVVKEAVGAGLRIAPQSTGHGAPSLALKRLDDVVLLRTVALAEVTVDVERRIVRVGAGVEWQAVVEAAAAHGLAVLHGSSPNVGVAGYSLGGGIGWFARKLGLATNSITALEVVTADGTQLRADDTQNTDLFWALRGGGANFGVVTAIELRLFDIADAYAGMLMWDLADGERVLRRWAEWTRTAPDGVTTSFRFMRFPPLPELPDFLRGRSVVVIDGAVLADDATAERVLAPLRELAPQLDTFGRVPAVALTRIHMDPEDPVPAAGGNILLGELDDAALDAFLDAAGPKATSSLLFAELRQLGGALSRPAENSGVLSHLAGHFAGFFLAITPVPEAVEAARADAAKLVAAMTPWAAGGSYLNFAEEEVDVRGAFDVDDWARLLSIRAQVDPNEVFVANHRVA